MITGFFILVTFYLAYRLNRDEGIMLVMQERITTLETVIQEKTEEKISAEKV